MAITKMDHVAILAKDSGKTVDFYREFLGFKETFRQEIKLMHIVIILLERDGDKIEVIEPTGNDIMMNDGLKHIAFLSDDIDSDFESFQKKGAKLLHKEVQRHEKVAFFFARSPSGEFVEVIQHF
ncbi:MAG: VOC family protein [Candidatus Eremiobacteraeota bacterium]|nr:VOC family protein [Candidatus Eremiobacteraeota bacterium]